jgi:hypothetical protein
MGARRALKAGVFFLDDRCPGGFLGLDPGQDQHLSGGSNSKDALDQVQAVGDPAAQGIPVDLGPVGRNRCLGERIAQTARLRRSASLCSPRNRHWWRNLPTAESGKNLSHAKSPRRAQFPWVTPDDVDEWAEELGVSTDVVERQIENHRLAALAGY